MTSDPADVSLDPFHDRPARFSADALRALATELLVRAGLATEQASCVASILVEGDLLGHSTHGLQLLTSYVRDAEAGRMATGREPTVISDRDSALTWDGHFLPGPWLVTKAIDAAFERLQRHPVVTVVIRRSHHIGCLAAYLSRATDRGCVMLLSCSDPSVASVAPFGAVAGRYTPNPIAAGFPTDGDPVLLDVSMSTTTNGLVARLQRTGAEVRLPGLWLVDNAGGASDDPAVMLAQPPGAILPLGGIDLGHKGFALGLLVEALTSALAGHGRADGETRWGATVFLQLIDPAGFAGLDAFRRETGWLAATCRQAPVAAGAAPVRLPGERALALRREQLEEGVALHPETVIAMAELARRFDLAMPAAISAES